MSRGLSMRTMFAVLAAALAVASPAALAQDKCSETYGTCMNTCASSKVKIGQDRCVENCQSRSNQCYEKSLGSRPQTIITGEKPLAPAPAGDALASQPQVAAPPVAAPQAQPAPVAAPAAQAPAKK